MLVTPEMINYKIKLIFLWTTVRAEHVWSSARVCQVTNIYSDVFCSVCGSEVPQLLLLLLSLSLSLSGCVCVKVLA